MYFRTVYPGLLDGEEEMYETILKRILEDLVWRKQSEFW